MSLTLKIIKIFYFSNVSCNFVSFNPILSLKLSHGCGIKYAETFNIHRNFSCIVICSLIMLIERIYELIYLFLICLFKYKRQLISEIFLHSKIFISFSIINSLQVSKWLRDKLSRMYDYGTTGVRLRIVPDCNNYLYLNSIELVL